MRCLGEDLGRDQRVGRTFVGRTVINMARAPSNVYLAIHHWYLFDRSHCEGRRSFQLHKNWEGKGRTVARMLTPPGSNDHHIKVDEKAGICVTTRLWGGLTVTHLFSGTILWCLPDVRESFLFKL